MSEEGAKLSNCPTPYDRFSCTQSRPPIIQHISVLYIADIQTIYLYLYHIQQTCSNYSQFRFYFVCILLYRKDEGRILRLAKTLSDTLPVQFTRGKQVQLMGLNSAWFPSIGGVYKNACFWSLFEVFKKVAIFHYPVSVHQNHHSICCNEHQFEAPVS